LNSTLSVSICLISSNHSFYCFVLTANKLAGRQKSILTKSKRIWSISITLKLRKWNEMCAISIFFNRFIIDAFGIAEKKDFFLLTFSTVYRTEFYCLKAETEWKVFDGSGSNEKWEKYRGERKGEREKERERSVGQSLLHRSLDSDRD